MTLFFKNISYAYGDTDVLSDLDFAAQSGEITCLLGPSGGGKSTLLRLAAGLESVQAGSIELDDQLLANASYHLAPEKRPVGLMFQENALFPHMSIADNIAYGLDHLSKSDRLQRVKTLLEMVGLDDYGERYPHALSGGQQQRVALVRSLAPQPSVLLMDEPFASIDITLRRALREASRYTLKQSATTVVMVTHDPPEAMEMADTIAVLDEGKVLQVGSPQVIYEQPSCAAVAALFGDAQRLSAHYEHGHYVTIYGRIAGSAPIELSQSGAACELVTRPDGLILSKQSASGLVVVDMRYVGDVWIAFLLPENAPLAMTPLRVTVSAALQLDVGDHVALHVGLSGFYVYGTS